MTEVEVGLGEAKGLAFVGALAFAERAPGGLHAVREAMEPRCREVLEPLYLASAWYELRVLADLMGATAECMGRPRETLIREQARRAAQSDVEGMYRHTLSAASAEGMAKRLPRAFSRYFRPMRAETLTVSKGLFEARLAPLPLELEPFLSSMNEGFVVGALETTGVSPHFAWRAREVLTGERSARTFRVSW